jgi:hypothetical protein
MIPTDYETALRTEIAAIRRIVAALQTLDEPARQRTGVAERQVRTEGGGERMSWAVGYDTNWRRDIGYGVPAECDHPDCTGKIDRGLGYVCGGEPYGGEKGCGLYFCESHLYAAPQRCDRCLEDKPPFDPTPDLAEWSAHKLTDESWGQWRAEHPDEVARLTADLQYLPKEQT